MRIVAIALVSALALSGCIKETAHYASDKMVRDVAYVHDGPPRISLCTMEIMKAGQGHTLLW
jgi:PBP1b-binding outer membrane lipoprotein LpoB